MNPLRKSAPVSVEALQSRLAQMDTDTDAAQREYDAVALAEADGTADAAKVERAHHALTAATQLRDRTATALEAAKQREADTARDGERAELAAAWNASIAISDERAKLAATLQTTLEDAAAAYLAIADKTDELCRTLPPIGAASGIHASHAFATGGNLLFQFLGAELHRVRIMPDHMLAGAVVAPLSQRYRETVSALKRSRDESLLSFDGEPDHE